MLVDAIDFNVIIDFNVVEMGWLLKKKTSDGLSHELGGIQAAAVDFRGEIVGKLDRYRHGLQINAPWKWGQLRVDARGVSNVLSVCGHADRLHYAFSKRREVIVARLLESLDGPPDRGVDEAWAVEIERRCAALDSGEAVSSDWNEVRDRIDREIFAR